MALCTEKTLADLISGNMTDAEIAQSRFTASITGKLSDSVQVIDEHSTAASVTFQNNKRFLNMCESQTTG